MPLAYAWDIEYRHLQKYVVVNIPSFELRAVDNGNVQAMNICCGEINFKTPLLSSWIKRMDVNPQWIVPKSISKGFLHNYSYMHKMGMFVLDKKKVSCLLNRFPTIK